MQSLPTEGYIAVCIGTGFADSVASPQVLRHLCSIGAGEQSRPLGLYSAALVDASTYSVYIRSLLVAALEEGQVPYSSDPIGLVVAARFGRWYGAHLVLGGFPQVSKERCTDIIGILVPSYFCPVVTERA